MMRFKSPLVVLVVLVVVFLAPSFGAAAETQPPIALKPLSVTEGGYAYPRPLSGEVGQQVLVSRGEGWVLFQARIAANGAVEDVQVIRATGKPAQMAYVLEMVKAWRWQPAQHGGQAVAGTASRRVVFRTSAVMKGKADASVASAFADVMQAAERRDRAGAEAAFSLLAARTEFNSAEWTLKQIAASRIQREWGTPLQEYLALEGAWAGGSAAFAALPPGFRRSAQLDEFRLLLALGRYGDARRVGTYALQAAEDGDTKARVAAALAKLERIAAGATPTRMTLQLGPLGGESVRLSRRQFAFAEGGAAVTEARLFCREGAAEVPLQTGAVYQVDAGATDCRVDLVGTPDAVVVIEER